MAFLLPSFAGGEVDGPWLGDGSQPPGEDEGVSWGKSSRGPEGGPRGSAKLWMLAGYLMWLDIEASMRLCLPLV